MSHHPIYIGTILLEKNRWAPGRQPSIRVVEWIDRFKQSGFDGMELWENHAMLAPEGDIEAMLATGFPINVFSSYVSFDDEAVEQRQQVGDAIRKVHAEGVKYNLGPDPTRRDEYVRNLRGWRDIVMAGSRMLCECHAGTVMENPETALEVIHTINDPAFRVMVHPFHQSLSELVSWFELLGPKIDHAHVQLREDGMPVNLSRDVQRVREAVSIMKHNGFSGSFTLEFTEGTRAPDENAEALFEAALRDLDVLRNALG